MVSLAGSIAITLVGIGASILAKGVGGLWGGRVDKVAVFLGVIGAEIVDGLFGALDIPGDHLVSAQEAWVDATFP